LHDLVEPEAKASSSSLKPAPRAWYSLLPLPEPHRASRQQLPE